MNQDGIGASTVVASMARNEGYACFNTHLGITLVSPERETLLLARDLTIGDVHMVEVVMDDEKQLEVFHLKPLLPNECGVLQRVVDWMYEWAVANHMGKQ